MQVFRKRHYSHPSELLGDLRAVRQARALAHRMGPGAVIDRAFQERIMLAVTEVNGCRYCAYAHARVALTAGLTKPEINALADGSTQGAPPDQVPALLYAQHWAEANACPDPAARRTILDTYGPEETAAIESAMRMIRVGNLLGNTGDYLLFRISCGRWGQPRP